MNFQEYRSFKDGLALEKFTRLDCMNPGKAMSPYLYPTRSCNYDSFLSSLRGALQYDGPLAMSYGIRSSLETIASTYINDNVYIPLEVYPVYFEIFKKNYIKTYSIFDNNSLFNTHNSVILYTLNHFGTLRLNIQKAEKLISQGNILIIDAVYDYQQSLIEFLPLIETQSCYILGSLSKTQLTRALGFNIHKTDTSFESPHHYRNIQSSFPAMQLQIFNLRWKQIEDQLDIFVRQTCHPYFRIIDQIFYDLLEQNILGIPLSVFYLNEPASRNDQQTIVTCLYEIDTHIEPQSLSN